MWDFHACGYDVVEAFDRLVSRSASDLTLSFIHTESNCVYVHSRHSQTSHSESSQMWETAAVTHLWYRLCSLRLIAVFSLSRPNLPRLDSFDYMEFVHRPRLSVWKGFKTMLRVLLMTWVTNLWGEKKKKNANVSHGKIKIALWWTLFKELCKLPMQVSSCKCKRMSSHLFEFGFLVPWVNPAMSSVQWLSQYPNTSAFHVELMSWSDVAWWELEKRKWLVGFCSPIPSVTFSFSVWPPKALCKHAVAVCHQIGLLSHQCNVIHIMIYCCKIAQESQLLHLMISKSP